MVINICVASAFMTVLVGTVLGIASVLISFIG